MAACRQTDVCVTGLPLRVHALSRSLASTAGTSELGSRTWAYL
jgi:hypothetical protein